MIKQNHSSKFFVFDTDVSSVLLFFSPRRCALSGSTSPNRLVPFSLFGLIVLLLGVIAAIQLGVFQTRKPVAKPEGSKPTEIDKGREIIHKPLAESLGIKKGDMELYGDVLRPSRDLQADRVEPVAAREAYLKQVRNPGRAPFIPLDTSPQVAALAKELDTNIGKSPAKSTYYGAEPFEREEYLKDPRAYLDLVRPARVFQSAQPGPNVPRLASQTEFFQEIIQGESVLLEVKVEPGLPVTFHAPLGEFDNRLKTITVAASEDGVAKVKYHAVSGVQGMMNIMAASPVHSGQLKFLVNVNLPAS